MIIGCTAAAGSMGGLLIPGSAFSTSATINCFALATCSREPVSLTLQRAPVLSTSIRAPLCSWNSRTREPCAPINAPEIDFGKSTYSELSSSICMAIVNSVFFARLTFSGGPLMWHLQGSTSKSTSIFVPVLVWISLTWAPLRPMTMPILARGISTHSEPACLFLVLSISSLIKTLAFLTASAVPATFTWQGSPVWSRASTLKAPLFSRISIIVCACLPMTFPSKALGTGTNSSMAGSRKMGTLSGDSSRCRSSSQSSLSPRSPRSRLSKPLLP
mmetsp:Transcript_86550/g.171825  ORF Transcript_86550/g.171825 Transcript_86550/m.171825 type:complete len:274 (-) Transcript_86550:704-1525(-)